MLKYAHKQQSTQCFSQTETHCKIPLLTKIISACKVVIGESMSRVDAAPQAFVCGAFRCRSSAVILLAIFFATQRDGTTTLRPFGKGRHPLASPQEMCMLPPLSGGELSVNKHRLTVRLHVFVRHGVFKPVVLRQHAIVAIFHRIAYALRNVEICRKIVLFHKVVF